MKSLKPAQHKVKNRSRHRRAGLSLLEMILATAILMTGALTIARLSFVTSSHAMRAQDDSIALQIAAYQLEQIQLGRRPAEAVSLEPVIENNELGDLVSSESLGNKQITTWDDWYYSVSIQADRRKGLAVVQLDVYRFPASSAAAGNSSSLSSSANLSGSAPEADQSSGSTLGSGTADVDTAIYHRSFSTLIPAPQVSSSANPEMEETL